MEVKAARLYPNKLPRGYSSVIVAAVYLAEIQENGKESQRQKNAIWQRVGMLEHRHA
jgi:hypothetical protein